LKPHIISNNGAFVYNKTGQRLKSTGLDKSKAVEALEWLTENNYFHSVSSDQYTYVTGSAFCFLEKDFASLNPVPSVITDIERVEKMMGADRYVRMVDELKEILTEDVVIGSITAMSLDRDKLTTGRNYFKDYAGMAMTISGKELFEMVHPEVSKGNALEHLASYLDIAWSDIMAIGDNYNDISMLERAGISVAIGNAEPEVKEVCRYIAPTNDSHGVAFAIKECLADRMGRSERI